MTTVHIDEQPDETANMTVIAKDSDYVTADWAEKRGIKEIWVYDLDDGTRVVSYHVDLSPREFSIEELLGL